MKIKEILSNRQIFKVIYECEHCGAIDISKNYDHVYFHRTVLIRLKNTIPDKKCVKCGKATNKTGTNHD